MTEKNSNKQKPSMDKEPSDAIVMVHNALREKIMNKELLPGEKINQIAEANLLHVSRTPVVNALHRLESEGLVDRTQNSGFTVHRLSIGELQELFDLREVFDIIVANDLAINATDEEIDVLENLFSHYLTHPEELTVETYRALDLEFHTLLVKYCRNSMMHKIYDNFQILARTYTAGLIRHYTETLQEHMTIINAFRQHDPKAAEKEMREHNAKTTSLIHETISGLKRMGLDPGTIHVDDVMLSRTDRAAP